MAYNFPLPLNDFFGTIPITSIEIDLGDALEYSQTGASEILTADLGDRLWRANVNIPTLDYAAGEALRAKLDVLRYAGRSLIVHAIPLIAPQADPFGVVLGASNVTLNAVQSNNRDIRLGGLPAGYELRPGDAFSFQYGANPTRYACHRLVQGGFADQNGVTSLLESSSFIQPGYAIGAAVKLIKPEFKAVLVPGSVNAGKTGQQRTEGISFSFVQTFRY